LLPCTVLLDWTVPLGMKILFIDSSGEVDG